MPDCIRFRFQSLSNFGFLIYEDINYLQSGFIWARHIGFGLKSQWFLISWGYLLSATDGVSSSMIRHLRNTEHGLSFCYLACKLASSWNSNWWLLVSRYYYMECVPFVWPRRPSRGCRFLVLLHVTLSVLVIQCVLRLLLGCQGFQSARSQLTRLPRLWLVGCLDRDHSPLMVVFWGAEGGWGGHSCVILQSKVSCISVYLQASLCPLYWNNEKSCCFPSIANRNKHI